jgi:non-specific serine/threonine protein kinase
VTLFVQRAQAHQPGFLLTTENAEAVVGICRRLDGLPLAIELAAAQTRILTPRELLARLAHILTVLVGGARDRPERQRTIRNTIAWSYDLLRPADQRLFRTLTIFVGGWSLDTAEAVSDPNIDALAGITTLFDHNLVRRVEQPDGSTRFTMLETIREFGLEQLRSLDEDAEIYRRYLNYLLQAFSESERDWHTPQVVGWLQYGDAEHENVRHVLDWANANDPVAGLRLARVFAWYWFMRGAVPESQRWLTQGLANAGNVPDDLRAHVLWQIGSNATTLGEFAQARNAQEEARAIYSDLGDEVGIGNCLHGLGRIAHFSGDVDQAVASYQSAAEIFRHHHHPRLMVTLSNLGFALQEIHELDQASVVLDEALEIAERHGHHWHRAQVLGAQGDLALARGDLRGARQVMHRCVRLNEEAGDPRFIAQTFESCAWLATREGDISHAARLLGAAARLRETIGVPVPPSTERAYDRHVPTILALLGPGGWQRAWTDGHGLGLAEATAFALDGLADVSIASLASASRPASLTDRELEVLRLIATGRSNKEIAAQLSISIRTVERHINNLYRKIDAQNKADATAFAIRHNLA